MRSIGLLPPKPIAIGLGVLALGILEPGVEVAVVFGDLLGGSLLALGKTQVEGGGGGQVDS